MNQPTPAGPAVVDRATFQAELDELRVREKAHTREGDAIAAARRRLPMVEVDASLTLTGPHGPVTLLDAFEGRRQLIAYYFMWWDGHPAAEQCEGCTLYTTQVARAVLPAFPRHHLRGLLPGTLRREHPLPRLHGLGHALVLRAGLPRHAPGRAPDRPVPPGVLPAGRRPRLRDLLDQTPRRRGHGLQLRAHGPDRVRAPGAVGGLTPRLAAGVHQHADRRRPARLAARARVAGRTPHQPSGRDSKPATPTTSPPRPEREPVAPPPSVVLALARRGVRPGTGRGGPTPRSIPLPSACVRPNGCRRAR